MRAKLVLDQFANPDKATGPLKERIKYIRGRGSNMVAIFPKGTEFDGQTALDMCKRGQAEPADEECTAALGMTEEERRERQLEYSMDALGINRKEDRKLFEAGVILGYDKELNYIPGPKWEAYHRAKAENEAAEDEL